MVCVAPGCQSGARTLTCGSLHLIRREGNQFFDFCSVSQDRSQEEPGKLIEELKVNETKDPNKVFHPSLIKVSPYEEIFGQGQARKNWKEASWKAKTPEDFYKKVVLWQPERDRLSR